MATSPAKTLVINEEIVGPAVVLRLRGSAGMEEADHLRRRLEELAAKKSPLIVLDLTAMEFISSLGLGAIVTGHLRSRHHNGQLRLVNPQPAVLHLLETTRLTKLFGIYSSVEKAIAPLPPEPVAR